MNKSAVSRVSNASSQMMEELANRSQTKIYKIEGSFNDQEMRVIWNALGLYISRNLRMGRGVNVPKLGVFTFTPPQVNLKGVTNQLQRDQRPRTPVFLIQKQFIKGVPLKSAIFYHQQFGLGLRPYTALGATGDIPVTKMNLLQVSSYANMNKDQTQLGIRRMIKYITQKLLSGQNVSLQIPNVGTLLARNNLVAVKFNQFLQRDTRKVLAKSVDERKQRGQMKLTADNLKKFGYLSLMNQKLMNKPEQFLNIDEKAKTYLSQTYGFHFDPNNLNRSTSNFDRTVASKEFDIRNRSLKSSQFNRTSQTNQQNYLKSKIKSFNVQNNMALKIVRQWVQQNCSNSQNCFRDFCRIATNQLKQALNVDDIWVACQCISVDITEQQAHQLFRILDNNKDGFITKQDFNTVIGLENWKSSYTKSFVDILQSKFKSAGQAYRCMCSYKPRQQVDYTKFQRFTQQICGDKFKKNNIIDIWKSLVGTKNVLTYRDFNQMIGNRSTWLNQTNPIDVQYPKDDWQYQDFNIIKGTQIRSSQYQYKQSDDMQVQANKIVNNVKDMLATSAKSLEQVFSQVDTEKKGFVTNLQFKKAFRNLNIALTSKEIDLLLNYCQFKLQTLIDWKQFIRKFNVRADKQKIAVKIAPKMQHLSDLLHYYMISPKDAYRKWNNSRTGYMNFEEFHKMLKNVFEQASQPLPDYRIIKQYFDFIDIRKDNQLDFQQFTQSFRNYKPPSLLMGTTPIQKKSQLNSQQKQRKQQNLPIRQQLIPLFKHSPQYQQFVKLIGRNRRYLQQKIQKLNTDHKQLVPFSIIQKIVIAFASQHKFFIQSALLRNMVAFSMTGDNVDYRMMLDNFKTRKEDIVQFPLKRQF